MSNGWTHRICALAAVCVLAAAGQAYAQSLSAPSNLTATVLSSSSIRLNWVDNQNKPTEDGFDVERSTSPTAGFVVVGSVGTDATTFTSSGLTSNVLYYFRVRAKRGNGNFSPYSNVASATPLSSTTSTSTSSTTSSTLAPGSTTSTIVSTTTSTTVSQLAPPSNLSAAPASASSIRLNWVDNQKNPKESGFDVERSPNGNSNWVVIATVGTNVETYTNTGLGSGTYFYRVRTKRNGNSSAHSNLASATLGSSGTTSTSTSTSTSSTTAVTNTSTSSTSTSSSTSTTNGPGSTTSTSTSTSTSTTSTTVVAGGPALVGFVPGVGTAMGLHVASGLAVVGSQEFGLSAVNVANPALPVAVGGADRPFTGLHVARVATLPVTTGQTDAGFAQLWVLDVSDTTRPRIQGELATGLTQGSGTGFQRVAMTPNGSYAVAAVGNWGMWTIDVSVPTAPAVRGTVATGGIAWGVAVNSTGSHAYVAAGTAGLKVVSLANPAAPVVVGTSTTSGRNYRDVAVVGTTAYLANQSGTLDIYNVATPTAPQWIGVATLTGFGLRLAAEGTMVAVLTGLSATDQLDVYDVTNPGAPVRRSSVVLGPPGTGQGVAIAGGLAYVAAQAEGLRIYDARVTNPPLSGAIEETFLPRNVAVKNTRAVVLGTYLPTNQVRFKVLDVGTATAPVVRGELGTTVTPAGSTGVALTPSANHAVAAMGGSGLWVVDVSVPTAPVLRGTVATGGVAWGVALNSTGSHAYVAAGTAGLKVVSLANLAAPAVVGTSTTPGRNYRDVAVVGTTAYLANQSGTLDIYNVATPTAPQWIGVATLTGYGLRVAAEGTLVTVVTGLSTTDQLDVYDVANPAAPVRRSSLVLGTPGAGQGTAQGSGQAFVATGAGGLRIYNLANPASPTLSASGLTVGDANGVAVQGGFAYVADYPATLSIVDW